MKIYRLSDDALQHGHDILVAAYDWLQSNNIKQWTAPMPLEVYQQWQKSGCNYGLYKDEQLVAVWSLVYESATDWDKLLGKRVLWLHALAINPLYRGQRIGVQAIRMIVEQLTEPLYLLCVDGFLPIYYARLDFVVVQADTKSYAGHDYRMVLMRYEPPT